MKHAKEACCSSGFLYDRDKPDSEPELARILVERCDLRRESRGTRELVTLSETALESCHPRRPTGAVDLGNASSVTVFGMRPTERKAR